MPLGHGSWVREKVCFRWALGTWYGLVVRERWVWELGLIGLADEVIGHRAWFELKLVEVGQNCGLCGLFCFGLGIKG